ncbi:MAG: hypothetical protein EAX81_00175 [Candidatus Thorarchaeota archaeon]|nr:hypothetical protein [Candidatus Thorarchaeota archaeon]
MGTTVVFGSLNRIPLVISQDPILHGPVAIEAYSEILRNASTNCILTAFNMAVIVVAFILPTILAYSFAGSLQNGFIKTLASYPLTRFQILVSKLGIAVICIDVIALSTCILPTALIIPGVKAIYDFCDTLIFLSHIGITCLV